MAKTEMRLLSLVVLLATVAAGPVLASDLSFDLGSSDYESLIAWWGSYGDNINSSLDYTEPNMYQDSNYPAWLDGTTYTDAYVEADTPDLEIEYGIKDGSHDPYTGWDRDPNNSALNILHMSSASSNGYAALAGADLSSPSTPDNVWYICISGTEAAVINSFRLGCLQEETADFIWTIYADSLGGTVLGGGDGSGGNINIADTWETISTPMDGAYDGDIYLEIVQTTGDATLIDSDYPVRLDDLDFDQVEAGDVDMDGDIDNVDFGKLYGSFTGASVPSLYEGTDHYDRADLLYDPNTGNVTLDSADAAGGVITSYALENASGLMEPNEATLCPFDGNSTDTATAYQISQTDLDQEGFPNTWDLGDILPTGNSLSQLEAFFSTAHYCGELGSGYYAFDLLRAYADDPRTWLQGDFDGDGDVDNVDFGALYGNYTGPSASGMDLQVTPEPATLALLGIAGMATLHRRRKTGASPP